MTRKSLLSAVRYVSTQMPGLIWTAMLCAVIAWIALNGAGWTR